MREAILALLLSFQPFHAEPRPETPEARQDRLRVAAEAIWDASEVRPRGLSKTAWAGVLVALGWNESRFAAYVGRDACETGRYRCDFDEKTGKSRAKGYFQAHRSACPGLWELPGGSVEWIRYSARCASGRLTGAYLRCRARAVSPLAGGFAGYRGSDCTWAPARRRAVDATRFASMLGG